jgi:hypothetical protein
LSIGIAALAPQDTTRGKSGFRQIVLHALNTAFKKGRQTMRNAAWSWTTLLNRTD